MFRHLILHISGSRLKQFQLIGVLLSQTKDFLFNIGFVSFQRIQVLQIFTKLYDLFVGNGSIDSCLKFAALVDVWDYVKGVNVMLQNVMDNGMRGLTKHARKHIIQFQVENGEKGQCLVLFTGHHVGYAQRIEHQVAQMANIR